MKFLAVIFVSIFGHIFALKCFQGTLNTTISSRTGTAVDCPDSNDIACVMKYDSNQKYANYMCSKNNCSVNSVIIRESVCVNVTATQKNCCCYNDACSYWFLSDVPPVPFSNTSNVTPGSSSSLTTPRPPSTTALLVTTSSTATLLTSPKLPSTGILKCLQGSFNTSDPLNMQIINSPSNASVCSYPNAITCQSQYDSFSKFVFFSCSTQNCTLNGKLISESICVNVSSYQKNCCCYGDGCNALLLAEEFAKNSLSTSNITTANTTLTIPKQSSSGSLKCLQGTISATNSTIGPAKLCLDPYAVTCIAQYDTSSKYAGFTCSNSNCTRNGLMVNISGCYNVNAYQFNCCCYGDDCNSATYATLKTSLFSSATNSSIYKNIISSPLTPRDAGGCENGYKILSSSADASSLAGKGKFAGYLGYRTSCQELCDKGFGLVKCVAYMFELHNRGKCTLFQLPIDSEVKEVLNSGASVLAKC